MHRNEEFEDPNNPVPSTSKCPERPAMSQEDKLKKIRLIVEREFGAEMNTRQEELNSIEQTLWSSRMYLHKLRLAVVTQYYNSTLTRTQVQDQIAEQHEPRAKAAVTAILENEQKRLHPSVKKLLGKKTVDIEEIFRFRGPRNVARKNYGAMLQLKNSTTAPESNKTVRSESNPDEEEVASGSRKIPRALKPKVDVVKINTHFEIERKSRFRIIVGNTSKYAPPSSKVDRSTHKWLLYVRGPHSNPDLSGLVTSVNVTLHDSYAPHHKISMEKTPFYISRRGWGEFPVKLQLNFKMPVQNRPVYLEHTIKLDRNYTGLQTLGSETVVDIWLYADEEMLKYEFVEEETPIPAHKIKEEIVETDERTDVNLENAEEPWLDYFTEQKNIKIEDMLVKEETKDIEECSPKKRLVKYIDPDNRKVYYLEMDRSLDVHKVQEIVINAKPKNGVNLTSTINNSHIENDHCYISKPNRTKVEYSPKVHESCIFYTDLCTNVSKFTCVRVAVMYLLSKIPIICENADSVYFPFVVPNEKLYWSYDAMKRRNIQWSRAKLINRILLTYFQTGSQVWRTKQILLFSRLYGYYPMRNGCEDAMDAVDAPPELASPAEPINTLSQFPLAKFNDNPIIEIDMTAEEEVDIVCLDSSKSRNDKPPIDKPPLELLSIDNSNYGIYLYIEETCSKLGILIVNDDVGNGYCYSIVHALIHCAMKKFVEELIRSSLAYKLTSRRKKIQEQEGVRHLPVWESWEGLSLEVFDICMGARWRLSNITNNSLGVQPRNKFAL